VGWAVRIVGWAVRIVGWVKGEGLGFGVGICGIRIWVQTTAHLALIRTQHLCSGFGSRVSGFGFRVSGFGSRVSGFGFRVSGFGFRVSGLGFRVWVASDVE
jgi:hypothetical protein